MSLARRLVPAVLCIAAGCAPDPRQNQPARRPIPLPADPSTTAVPLIPPPEPPPFTLARGEESAAAGSDIGRLLSEKVYPPAKARLAVARLGPLYAQPAADPAQAEQAATDDLLAALRKSPRLSDALVLPPLLTPQQVTVPSLRESAARLQADLLLVYRATRRTVPPAAAADDTRATCTVEAILFDTRTGVVLDTALATESFSARRAAGDAAPLAEQEAVGMALGRAAREVVRYLDAAPLPAEPAARPTTKP